MQTEKKRTIGFQLKAVNNQIRRNLDIRFAEAGLEEISGMQGPMLGYIYDHSRQQDVFQKDLERHFNIRRSTATVILQNLEQKGYIIREAVERDARLKRITLTEKAVEVHLAIRKQIDAFNEELEAGITEEEREAFFKVLDKVIHNLS
ncbi:MAG: MarR family transcriptional regulator [Lachnospiraceae bacterium]|nr:MarR family transcriptional regulator [Lachnospiraceae bacterium]